MRRIGIFAGTFDPVHSGHISFALQAAERAKLDKLYFLPERRPRAKHGVEHFAHRIAMLKKAARPYSKFDVMEVEDVSFTISRTLPKLQKKFQNSQLVFLFGSDIVVSLPAWSQANNMLKNCELVVGVRAEDSLEKIVQLIKTWPVQPKALTIFDSYAPDVSSSSVREALRKQNPGNGLLSSVKQYSKQHWLYVSLI
ncbi:MAG TPA: nicotinate (nicotinamide) nucleotide adenylyltransferase [Candidatus Saccharimonadales bacterium]|nr:nicotinate (nicotinamide) nucleotide adenylyltransferase [Candidatus Saccharimonadales bacterium]